MRDSLWLSATALLIAIMALGLGIAALVLALDDDDRGFVERRFSSGITPGGPGLPDGRGSDVLPNTPFPTPNRPGGVFPESTPGASRALLGVTVGEADFTGGIVVESVVPDSPADEAGLEVGDVVIAVDDEAVDGPLALVAAIAAKSPGDEITLSVERDGEPLELDATLGERPNVVPQFQFPRSREALPFERTPFGQGGGLDELRESFGFGDF